MAIITRKQFAVVETNHVSAVRTGNIKAQYPMDATMNTAGLQNGVAVTADDAAKLVKYPAVGSVLYLHASEEQIYEEHLGRNSFKLNAPKLPRLLKLEVGDIFETNAVLNEAIVAGDILNPLAADGMWAKTGGVKGNVQAKVVELVTLPNGEAGVKLAII